MDHKSVKYHRPAKLSTAPIALDYNVFPRELSNAQYALGKLESSHKELQTSRLLISPLSAKEATVSSRIEGTQSTVSDVFRSEAGGHTRYPDVLQVQNYRQAISYAINEINTRRPLTPHLVKTLHHILLDKVRHKGPLGQFRKGPVWIGEKENDPIEKALYVPPEHYLVQDYIDDLFKYVDSNADDSLILSGIAHYQFEAVHPFEDGNGRIGRLLVPLILYYKKRITQPILYISGRFDKFSQEYREALRSVDRTGKYDGWLKFYLDSVAAQLVETQSMIDSIYALYHKIRDQFAKTKSPNLVPLIDFIFRSPIFSQTMVVKNLRLADQKTARDLIKSLIKNELISPPRYSSSDKRVKLYEFRPLLKLLEAY